MAWKNYFTNFQCTKILFTVWPAWLYGLTFNKDNSRLYFEKSIDINIKIDDGYSATLPENYEI